MSIRGVLNQACRQAGHWARRATLRNRVVPGPDDVVVSESVVGNALTTVGRIIVTRQGCGLITTAHAERGVEVGGAFTGDLSTPGRVRVSRGGWLGGQCSAGSLVVEAGSEIDGFFEIGRDRLVERKPTPTGPPTAPACHDAPNA